jgi:inhibitor of cysteine peptidase
MAAVPGCGGNNIYGPKDTSISVKEGEEFTIKLEENPTTGYSWSVKISDESVLALSADNYLPDDKSGDMVGSGGKRELTFRAMKLGDVLIDMVYEQSWEPNPENQRLQFSVTVE